MKFDFDKKEVSEITYALGATMDKHINILHDLIEQHRSEYGIDAEYDVDVFDSITYISELSNLLTKITDAECDESRHNVLNDKEKKGGE